MKEQILLMEHLSPQEANLVESLSDGKDYYLNGRVMVAEERNGNNRIYDLAEMQKVVEDTNKKISQFGPIMGECQHPDTLAINIDRVSHCIQELKMDGNSVNGKMKLLNTPCGNIVRNLLDGGIRLGVSSRGTGSVGANGRVSGFNFTTIDVVSQPSGPGCYPNLVRESLENQKIVTLAEAVVEDKDAQTYLEKEIKAFLKKLIK